MMGSANPINWNDQPFSHFTQSEFTQSKSRQITLPVGRGEQSNSDIFY